MPVSRRAFLHSTAMAAAWPLTVRGWQAPPTAGAGLFQHGVASGDPLSDRVVLWTRVTPPASRSTGTIDVGWQIATDERLTNIVSRGTVQAAPQRDFTVKVDAANLNAGATYYYAFDAAGDQSPIGRTKTLPDKGAERLRLGQVSCSNYPTGYFNVYRCLANRPDLDAVVHLGDYIYEFANGRYSDPSLGRAALEPATEVVTLQDYRSRYAFYRRDADLQAVHRQHPFIVVWDDHELANDAWSGGAGNHNASQGDWMIRRRAAYQAYLEWLPIRESTSGEIQLYRRFAFGGLADLVMLDTRSLRDQQAPGSDAAAITSPRRSLLGANQESWLSETLRASQAAGTRWRILGQQIMFSSLTVPGMTVLRPDVWDGYPAARERIFDMIDGGRITDLAVLTGDIHSSWALDLARDPWAEYEPATGKGSRGVEIVTPAVSSPPMFSTPAQREVATMLRPLARHLKFLDGDSRGYVLLDVTSKALTAEWYFVPTVTERTERETRAARFVSESGSARFVAE